MALITCPECGREISDQAKACIHCGYPLEHAKEDRFALVLLDAGGDLDKTAEALQGIPGYEAWEKAVATAADVLPAVLLRGLPYDECSALAARFNSTVPAPPAGDFANLTQEYRGAARVRVIRDADADDLSSLSEAPAAKPPSPAPAEAAPAESGGMGFGGTVLAVILGVIAALVILSFL